MLRAVEQTAHVHCRESGFFTHFMHQRFVPEFTCLRSPTRQRPEESGVLRPLLMHEEQIASGADDPTADHHVLLAQRSSPSSPVLLQRA